jgi:hypothetical protein
MCLLKEAFFCANYINIGCTKLRHVATIPEEYKTTWRKYNKKTVMLEIRVHIKFRGSEAARG